jgi:hypothetical protein
MTAVPDSAPARTLEDALESARGSLGDAADAPMWTVGDEGLVGLVVAAGEVVARAQAVLLRLVGEADARDALVAQGASSSRSWLRHRLRLAPAEASTYVTTAGALRSDLGATRAACAEGRVGLAQATVIARAVGELPPDGSPAGGAGWGRSGARRGPVPAAVHRPAAAGVGAARPGVRVPRLRPAAVLVRGPPPPALGPRWPDEPCQRRPSLRSPSPPGRARRVGGRAGRGRRPRVPPATVGRPGPPPPPQPPPSPTGLTAVGGGQGGV